MKTSNLSKSTIWNTLKQMLYALQVMIIVLAIPLLSYMELSHTEDKDQNSADKNSSKIAADKSEVVAYNLATTKQIL